MKHIWSVACQSSSIDKDFNSLSLFNSVEEITLNKDIKKEETVSLSFDVVSLWFLDDGQDNEILDIKGEFIDPENKLVNSYNRQMTIPKGFDRFRSRIRINGFTVTTVGIYWLQIKQKYNGKYKLVAELPIEVRVSSQNKDRDN